MQKEEEKIKEEESEEEKEEAISFFFVFLSFVCLFFCLFLLAFVKIDYFGWEKCSRVLVLHPLKLLPLFSLTHRCGKRKG